MKEIEIFINNIIQKIKEVKHLDTISDDFEEDLSNVFLWVPGDSRRKLYNNIIVYSISCPNEKSLTSFQLDLNLFDKWLKAKSLAVKFNRNCKNDIYKCK